MAVCLMFRPPQRDLNGELEHVMEPLDSRVLKSRGGKNSNGPIFPLVKFQMCGLGRTGWKRERNEVETFYFFSFARKENK